MRIFAGLLLSLFAGLALAAPSPNNTVIIKGSTASITDAATPPNIWTINAADQVAVNGVADTTTGGVTEIAYVNGLVYQEATTSNLWWSKTSPTATWAPSAGSSVSPLPAASAPSAILAWSAVTAYSNGSAIPASVAVTYNIYQGTSPTNLVKITTGITAVTSTITVGLVAGSTYYWTISCSANGLEGAQSNVGSKVFPLPTPVILPPGTVTLTVR
jgi:hypothetical protein